MDFEREMLRRLNGEQYESLLALCNERGITVAEFLRGAKIGARQYATEHMSEIVGGFDDEHLDTLLDASDDARIPVDEMVLSIFESQEWQDDIRARLDEKR